jgi:phosphomevalonate kinase
MSDALVARAPGKLFLLGEYAVLDGCPAVVAAVDRHIEVRLEREARGGPARINAPGCGAVEFAAAQPPLIDGPLRFVIAAFRAVLSRYPEIGRYGCSLSITSAMTAPGGVKIGLGSSAAVVVGATTALLAAAGADTNRDELFATALKVHRAAQEGIGSGADVAASVYGGVVLFQPRAHLLPLVTPLALPMGTKLLAAWSGEPASTADLVSQYLGARNGHAAARAAFVAASRTCVDSFVDGLRQGALSHAAVDGNADALEQLAYQLGLPVMTPRLAQLVAVARAHGAAAKVSGAGNGDCGIALTRDTGAAECIRNAWRAAQLEPLDVALDPEGVTVARC